MVPIRSEIAVGSASHPHSFGLLVLSNELFDLGWVEIGGPDPPADITNCHPDGLRIGWNRQMQREVRVARRSRLVGKPQREFIHAIGDENGVFVERREYSDNGCSLRIIGTGFFRKRIIVDGNFTSGDVFGAQLAAL